MSNRVRNAFTLIEMLVAVGIVILLLGLVLAFYPKREQRAAVMTASQIETYLSAAKVRALRNNTLVGVRLLSNDGDATFYGMQLIDPRDRFAPFDPSARNTYLDLPAGASIQAMNQNANPNVVGNTVRQTGVSLHGNVEVGDLLEIVEVTPSVHRITAIDYNTGVVTLAANKIRQSDGSWFVTGIPNVSCVSSARLGCNYRYLRKPGPVMGEPVFQFPKDVYVRGPMNVPPTSANIPTGGSGAYEILFSPAGLVTNASSGRVILWVEDANNVAKPQLVCIYASTGGIKVCDVGPSGSEFQFTRDGR